ncbi:MAG: hypothetical protein Q4D16_25215 [Eubacteriales bacterium]|nr:hypothetical protein [Eubacteriales bacterium]
MISLNFLDDFLRAGLVKLISDKEKPWTKGDRRAEKPDGFGRRDAGGLSDS